MTCKGSCTNSFSILFKIDTNYLELLYGDLPEISLADRFKKARLIKGINQEQLACLTHLSKSTIQDLEVGNRNTLYKDTLLKLLTVLDKEILCDDYLNYILEQRKNISALINKFGIVKLTKLLGSHHSTIYRWQNEKTPFHEKSII